MNSNNNSFSRMIHKQLDYRLYLLFYYNFKDTLTLLDQRNIPPDP